MSSTLYDAVVVGAGLCGLSSAVQLKKKGVRVLVLEARAEPGGRIRSVRDFETGESLGDLGPSWVWPNQQPAVRAWLDTLAVSTFRQHSTGLALSDMSANSRPETQQISEQADAYRIDAGSFTLVSRLAGALDSDELCCSEVVDKIDTTGGHVLLRSHARTEPVQARQVIVALPPRIALQGIDYIPALGRELAECLQQTSTWLSTQAKLVILYAEPFWRKRGLSGRVFSHIGPIGELQDHCGPAGYPAALTGYLSWSAQRRAAEADTLPEQIAAQLQRLFGPATPKPLHLVIKDWAQDEFVATDRDRNEGQEATQVMPPVVRQPHGSGKLWFAGAETASTGAGLIEGAFARADDVVNKVLKQL